VNADLSEPEAEQPRSGQAPVGPPSESPGAPPGESGQGIVEYALIIFLVAIVVIAILLLLGPQIGEVFSSLYATI